MIFSGSNPEPTNVGKAAAPPPDMADNAGRWTNEEHDRFLQGLDMYGKKWTKVAEVVGSRSTVQVEHPVLIYSMKPCCNVNTFL